MRDGGVREMEALRQKFSPTGDMKMAVQSDDIVVDGVAAQPQMPGRLFFAGAGEQLRQRLPQPGRQIRRRAGGADHRVGLPAPPQFVMEEMNQPLLQRLERFVCPGSMQAHNMDAGDIPSQLRMAEEKIVNTADAADFLNMRRARPFLVP